MRLGCGEIFVITNEIERNVSDFKQPLTLKSHLTRRAFVYICQSVNRSEDERSKIRSPRLHTMARCALRVCWWVWHFAARASQFVNQIMKLETPPPLYSSMAFVFMCTLAKDMQAALLHRRCVYINICAICVHYYHRGGGSVGSKMTLSHPTSQLSRPLSTAGNKTCYITTLDFCNSLNS